MPAAVLTVGRAPTPQLSRSIDAMGGSADAREALAYMLPVSLVAFLVGNWEQAACDFPLATSVRVGRAVAAQIRAPATRLGLTACATPPPPPAAR